MNQTKINALRYVISTRVEERLTALHTEDAKGAAAVAEQRAAFIKDVMLPAVFKLGAKELAPVVKAMEKLGSGAKIDLERQTFHRYNTSLTGTEEHVYLEARFSPTNAGDRYNCAPSGDAMVKVVVPQELRDKLAAMKYEPKYNLPSRDEVRAQVDLLVAEATLIDANILEKVEEMVKRLLTSLKLEAA